MSHSHCNFLMILENLSGAFTTILPQADESEYAYRKAGIKSSGNIPSLLIRFTTGAAHA